MVSPKSFHDLAELLNDRYRRYAQPFFIEGDPISIPHRFTCKPDVEISALLTSTFAWGSRKSIVNSATRLMEIMDWKPYEFTLNFSKREENRLKGFVHRTFSSANAVEFCYVLKDIYTNHGGLENVFAQGFRKSNSVEGAIAAYRNFFVQHEVSPGTLRHVPNISRGAAAKRINMFLRWMVRPQKEGVDFGLWHHIPTSKLLIPLDLHTGRVARRLGLLSRKQDDFRAVLELTESLTAFDASDPVKYDYALFGMGIHEHIK